MVVLLESFLFLMMIAMGFKMSSLNKLFSFECGFIGSGVVFRSFSIHFFVIMLMFVIFDMEIILLLGCLVTVWDSMFLSLMLLVVVGVYLEWYLGDRKSVV